MITIARLIRRRFMSMAGFSRQGTRVNTAKNTVTPNHSRTLAALIVLIAISGCSNSKLLLSPLYNRLDDQIRGEFHKLGDFNDDQVAAFEQRLGTFHVWHRQSELPQYAALLRDIVEPIKARETISLEQVGEWIETSEKHTQTLRACHPVNFSYELMQTLTDNELAFIQRRFASERRKNRKRYFDQTPEQRVERRHKNITKWVNRLDFEFTNSQDALLKETLEKQISLRKQYYKLSDRWNRKLFSYARNQSSPTYKKDMQAHVNSLWTLLENGYPGEWAANRRLWREFGHEFIGSLTGDQRRKVYIWLDKLADTLDSIAKDKPSFKVGNDPTLGCLVASG